MRPFSLRTLLCLLLVAAAAGAVSASAARMTTGKLVPYRGVYEMILRKAQSSTGINAADGRMTLEWMDACTGYTVNQRIVTDMSFGDGETLVTDLRMSTWEEASGKEFRFAFNNYMNGKLSEVTQGEAHFQPGQGGTADFQRPAELTVELPSGAVFPSKHGAELLAAALAGEQSMTRQVFDGAEEGALFRAVAFIGAMREPELTTNTKDVLWKRQLDHLESWPVIVSYYRVGDGGEVPEYEVSFRMYANGVADQLTLDYGDMTFDAKLSDLVIFKSPRCP